MVTTKIAVIDGDEIVYKCGYASQRKMHTVYIDGDEADGWIASFPKKKDADAWINNQGDLYIVEEILPASEAFAIYSTRMKISDIMRLSRCHHPLLAFSSDENYRKKAGSFIDYKGNRRPEDKPIHYNTIKDYLKANYPSVSVPGLEADDIIGIYMADSNNIKHHLDTENLSGDIEYIGCTQDKDLYTVPGKLFDLKSDKIKEITELEANRFLYIQMLTGDAVDNVPGLSQLCGRNCTANMKKHIQSLNTEKEMYDYVVKQYAKSYSCAKEIVDRIAECLYIQRKSFQRWSRPE